MSGYLDHAVREMLFSCDVQAGKLNPSRFYVMNRDKGCLNNH